MLADIKQYFSSFWKCPHSPVRKRERERVEFNSEDFLISCPEIHVKANGVWIKRIIVWNILY
jgi:hypothetical protein